MRSPHPDHLPAMRGLDCPAAAVRPAVGRRPGRRDPRVRARRKRQDRAAAILGRVRGARPTALRGSRWNVGSTMRSASGCRSSTSLPGQPAGRVRRARRAPRPAFGGLAVVERLLSDLHSLEQPVVLVIDDLHELRSAEALRWLELFLTELPPELRVALATREDPTLGLHRLRLAGRLTEIRADRPALLPGGDARAHRRERGHAVRHGLGAASRADRRVGGGPAAGGDLARPAPRPGALRGRVLRQRAHRGGLPAGGGAGAPAAGGPRPAAAHLGARARQRPTRRRADRQNGLRSDAAEPGGRGRVRHLARCRRGRGFATTTCSPICCSSNCDGPPRRSSARCTARRHCGSRSRASWSRRSATRRRRATGRTPRGCSPTTMSDLVFDGRKATLRALLAAFPADAPEADAELALAFATGRLYDGAARRERRPHRRRGAAGRDSAREHRELFDLRLTSARLWLASQRGDLDTARQAMRALEAQPAGTPARSNDHRASALMNFGIAELWSLQLDDARRDLEEALALARRIGRPYLEIGCLSQLALAAVLSGVADPRGLRFSEEAVRIAEAHGWGTHRIVAPAVAAGAAALAWLGRFQEAEQLARPRGVAQVGRRTSSRSEPVLHYARGFVRLGQGRFEEALADFLARSACNASLAREHALPVDARGVDRADTGPDGRDGGGARRRSPLSIPQERDAIGHAHRRGGARVGGRPRRRMPSPCWRR